MSKKPLKILFFVSVDWFFCSHFIGRAIALRDAGYEVLIVTSLTQKKEQIEAERLRLIPVPLDRGSLNPFASLLVLYRVYRIYRRERPTLVHHFALKPILFGGIAARLSRVPHTVNSIVGAGYTSTATGVLARCLRPLLRNSLRMLLNPAGSKVIFENPDDLAECVEAKQVKPDAAVLIRGAGVDVERYSSAAVVLEIPTVILAARLLWDKGIGEFVEAARILHKNGVSARFVIVGDVDLGNRASIDKETLAKWREEGVVELWGFRADMPEVLARASIACLPSYREGLPKSLLEAMAAGLPCVTTDVPGCREAVRHQDNGLLVPVRDAHALAEALKLLILNPELRQRMGMSGRKRAEEEFSSTVVIKQTLALYEQMLFA